MATINRSESFPDHTNGNIKGDLPPQTCNNALEFEIAIKQVIATQMVKGLTVTEAVGTLQLCSMDIANQFF